MTWNVSNAFTSASRELDPIKLGAFSGTPATKIIGDLPALVKLEGRSSTMWPGGHDANSPAVLSLASG
jgi:hypothetical protein